MMSGGVVSNHQRANAPTKPNSERTITLGRKRTTIRQLLNIYSFFTFLSFLIMISFFFYSFFQRTTRRPTNGPLTTIQTSVWRPDVLEAALSVSTDRGSDAAEKTEAPPSPSPSTMGAVLKEGRKSRLRVWFADENHFEIGKRYVTV